MEAVQLPGPQGFWQHQAAGAAGDTALRRARQPVVANTLQDSRLEDPPTEEPGRPVYRIAELDATRASLRAWTQALPVAAPPVRAGVKAAPLLGLWGPWGAGGAGPRTASPRELWPGQRRCPSPASWWSEGLFGRSFSAAPPFQALRGLHCVRSLSVVRCISHSKGPPGWGPAL